MYPLAAMNLRLWPFQDHNLSWCMNIPKFCLEKHLAHHSPSPRHTQFFLAVSATPLGSWYFPLPSHQQEQNKSKILEHTNFTPLYFFSIFQFFFLPRWLSHFSTHLNKLVGLLKSRFLKPSMMALAMGTKGSWNLAITKDKNKFLYYS